MNLPFVKVSSKSIFTSTPLAASANKSGIEVTATLIAEAVDVTFAFNHCKTVVFSIPNTSATSIPSIVIVAPSVKVAEVSLIANVEPAAK